MGRFYLLAVSLAGLMVLWFIFSGVVSFNIDILKQKVSIVRIIEVLMIIVLGMVIKALYDIYFP